MLKDLKVLAFGAVTLGFFFGWDFGRVDLGPLFQVDLSVFFVWGWVGGNLGRVKPPFCIKPLRFLFFFSVLDSFI